MAGTPAQKGYNEAGNTDSSRKTVALCSWPTPRATDAEKNVRTLEGSLREIERKGSPQDLAQAAAISGWATPASRDYRHANAVPWSERGGGRKGEQLNNQVVHLAGWPTPQVDSFRSRSGARKDEMGLDQMARTIPEAPGGPARITADGALLTGSDAGMESGGQLNPAHSRWLMGYPVAWDACAPTATRSSRRSPPSSSAPMATP